MLKLIIYRLLKIPIPLYGVWVNDKDVGWLKGIKGAYSTPDRAQAKEVARWVGGEVRYIDEVLTDIERALLDIERAKE